ncbi:MAG: hypothetical protein ACQESR_26280, partial [Planctomycetota bacterium]
GGSRSPLQTGQTHHCWPSVAWNVTDHGTSPWHLYPAKPFFNLCNGSANVRGYRSLARERLRLAILIAVLDFAKTDACLPYFREID